MDVGKQEAAEIQPQEQVAAFVQGTAGTGEQISAAAWKMVFTASLRIGEPGRGQSGWCERLIGAWSMC